ncbi:glycine oxidase ThiO [Niallia sp. FSL W8-0635]|uniref:glycine oxidase ThiO n=1 Tax=Niallia sp. FSL W8-0635 TaxID=2975337 RepID=UPI0009C6E65B|nr:glycine oxidase [Mycobacteroides abscessus subsp. abscessus]HEO8422688.1 glycine oxidase ThiO [Yersinia enterocolitica]
MSLEARKVDVAIIGGGIIGSSIAFYLAKEKKKVAILEAHQVGGKSTSAAAGMLGAHSEYKEFKHLYPFARSSQLLYKDLYEEIRELTAIDFEKKNGGLLKLAYSEEEKRDLESILSLSSVEWLDCNEARGKVPQLAADFIGAAYLKEDVHITPLIACNGLSKGAQLFGAEIYEYTRVLRVEKNGMGYLLKTSQGTFLADKVVIASGVWSNYFFQQLGLSHEIVPVKGECVAVVNEGAPLHYSVFHDQFYIVPRNNNELIIGATKKWNDWSEEPSLDGIEEVIQKAKRMIPEIGEMKWKRAWAGLRPQTNDGYPFIGEHPEMKGLYFATGHQRNGILLAPATGKMIRDLMIGLPVEKAWIEAFKVERNNFALRGGM